MITMALGCTVLTLAPLVRVLSAGHTADLLCHRVINSQGVRHGCEGDVAHDSIIDGNYSSLIQFLRAIRQTPAEEEAPPPPAEEQAPPQIPEEAPPPIPTGEEVAKLSDDVQKIKENYVPRKEFEDLKHEFIKFKQSLARAVAPQEKHTPQVPRKGRNTHHEEPAKEDARQGPAKHTPQAPRKGESTHHEEPAKEDAHQGPAKHTPQAPRKGESIHHEEPAKEDAHQGPAKHTPQAPRKGESTRDEDAAKGEARATPAPPTPQSPPSCQRNADLVVDGEHTLWHNDLLRRYTIQRPEKYTLDEPRDVLVVFHGFGSNAQEILAKWNFLRYLAGGPILLAPEGVQQVGLRSLPSGFNGAGSSEGTGPKGVTCHPTADADLPTHHETCGKRSHRCAWSSCADDVGFVLAVLDIIKDSGCAEDRRVFAAGFSTGGQFIYEFATDPRSAGRLDAVAALQGSPHRGFLRHAPPGAQPRFLGVWAGKNSSFQDDIVPPFTSPGLDPDTSLGHGWYFTIWEGWRYLPGHGWYYSTARNTTDFWAQHVDCEASSMKGRTEFLGLGLFADREAAYTKQSASTNNSVQVVKPELKTDLSCTSACNGRVVECLRPTTEHHFAGFYPSFVWDFFTNPPK